MQGDDAMSLPPDARRATRLARLLPDRFRERFGRRAAALALTLLIEGLVLVLLFTMSPNFVQMRDNTLAVFNVGAEPAPAPVAEEKAPEPATRAAEETPPEPERDDTPPPPPRPPLSVQPAPSALPVIPMSRDEMAAADIAAIPARPAPGPRHAPMGPVDSGVAGDSERVGSAPNGEPLYAAAWYREPYAEELRGYLSTAEGPGWGLIACRTVADFRVEDCVGLDEWPVGSRINRAVLAAAWQFRVRPPRVGGRSKVGEWVRIRIDYGIKRR